MKSLSGIRSALGARRAYLGAVGGIALATVIGLVVLWPHGGAPKLKFTTAVATKTYSGSVISSTSFRCGRYISQTCQKLKLEVTDGPGKGTIVREELALGVGRPAYETGDEVRMLDEVPPGEEAKGVAPKYRLNDFERKPPLLWLTLAFAALVILFGRLRGALSLVGLAISLVIILLFVVPAITHDSPPLAVGLVGSMAVMLTTIPLAHGLGLKSLAAMTGIAASLAIIVVLAVIFANLTHLTGVTSEEAATLAISYKGINFQSLLVAGIVIGALGVLDDVAISQASTVLALRAANQQLGFRDLFSRAIEVGRDHVSATVNTLVLAYAGSSLTTLLILGSGQFGVLEAINLEVVASFVVATLVGSIGLICAVPITTAFAALLAENVSEQELAAESHAAHAH
jgi:uncharacterized membrane protein